MICANRFERGRSSVVGAACVLALVGSVTAGCNEFRETPLVRSVPVQLMRPVDLKTVESAIESSFAKRHWVIKEHTGQKYVAVLSERSHTVTVAVLYDGASARIDYLDSTNLRYENRPEGEVIHKKYQTWVKNLGEEIKIAASHTAAAAPTAVPAPPPTAAPAPAPAPTAAPR
jgi:hypothetical protein